MSGRKRERRPIGIHVESQDDIGYLTGKRSQAEEERQIKTPSPRRSGRPHIGRRKEEGDSDSKEG